MEINTSIKNKEQALDLMSNLAKSFNIENKEYMQRGITEKKNTNKQSICCSSSVFYLISTFLAKSKYDNSWIENFINNIFPSTSNTINIDYNVGGKSERIFDQTISYPIITQFNSLSANPIYTRNLNTYRFWSTFQDAYNGATSIGNYADRDYLAVYKQYPNQFTTIDSIKIGEMKKIEHGFYNTTEIRAQKSDTTMYTYINHGTLVMGGEYASSTYKNFKNQHTLKINMGSNYKVFIPVILI